MLVGSTSYKLKKCYNYFITLAFGKKSLRYFLIGMQMYDSAYV